MVVRAGRRFVAELEAGIARAPLCSFNLRTARKGGAVVASVPQTSALTRLRHAA